MVRYPHSAIIQVSSSTKDVNGDNVLTVVETPIIGRYEPAAQQSNLNFSGKFYCAKTNFQPFELEGQKLKYNNILFEIYQSMNFQNHCELWLK